MEWRRDETLQWDINPSQALARVDRLLDGSAVMGRFIRQQAFGDLPQHAGSSNSGSLANLLASRIGRPESAMSSKPFMQLYVGDLLADTQALNMAELGAYLSLLLNQWARGGALPADRLHSMCRMSKREFAKISPQIEQYFSQDEDGNWYNKTSRKRACRIPCKSCGKI